MRTDRSGSSIEGFVQRDFLLAMAGYFFLYMGISLFYIYPLFFKSLPVTQSRIGMIMGITSPTAIAVRPLFGRSIDLRGGRVVALLGLAMMAVSTPFFHLVRDAGWLPLALRAVTGIGWGISMTATIAVCSDLAPVEKMAQSIGIVGAAGLVANAVGPLLGESLITRWGFGALYDVSLGFFLLAFGFIFATKELVRPPSSGGDGRKRLRAAATLGTLALMAMITVAHGAVRSSVLYFIALFGKSISLPRVGAFFLAFSGAAILTRLGIGDISDRIGRKQVIFPSALIIAFNLLILSQVRSFGLLILSGFVAGFGQGLIFPALSTYIIDVMGRANKGLALGFYLSLFDVGMSLGAPFFGWISDLTDYRRMYIAAAVFIFAASVLFQLKAPEPPSAAGPVPDRSR